jgi:formate hydrogenlyase subunit 3/multisubunit Na+/H+ antiporter MnhD subunit
MSLEYVLVFGYLIVGIILTFIWWYDEYKPEYELVKELNEGSEEPMVVLFLICLAFFWPFKVVKNYFESFVD